MITDHALNGEHQVRSALTIACSQQPCSPAPSPSTPPSPTRKNESKPTSINGRPLRSTTCVLKVLIPGRRQSGRITNRHRRASMPPSCAPSRSSPPPRALHHLENSRTPLSPCQSSPPSAIPWATCTAVPSPCSLIWRRRWPQLPLRRGGGGNSEACRGRWG